MTARSIDQISIEIILDLFNIWMSQTYCSPLKLDWKLLYVPICRWDPIARTWSYVASMSTMRSTAGVAILNNRLYVVGGRDGSSCHCSMECYDPHTNKWTMRAPMNRRRGGVGVAVANGFLYALGGHDLPASTGQSTRTDTVERYDPATDTWTLVSCFLFLFIFIRHQKDVHFMIFSLSIWM